MCMVRSPKVSMRIIRRSSAGRRWKKGLLVVAAAVGDSERMFSRCGGRNGILLSEDDALHLLECSLLQSQSPSVLSILTFYIAIHFQDEIGPSRLV